MPPSTLVHSFRTINSLSLSLSRISQKYPDISTLFEVCFLFRQCNSFTFQSGQFADSRWENAKKICENIWFLLLVNIHLRLDWNTALWHQKMFSVSHFPITWFANPQKTGPRQQSKMYFLHKTGGLNLAACCPTKEPRQRVKRRLYQACPLSISAGSVSTVSKNLKYSLWISWHLITSRGHFGRQVREQDVQLHSVGGLHVQSRGQQDGQSPASYKGGFSLPS